MKKLIYLASTFLFFGCTVIKQLNSEEVKVLKDCSNLVFDKQKALIDIEIDHVNTKFILDTGAGISALIDSTVIDFKNKKIGILGSVKGADRKKIKNKFLSVSLKNNLFESDNKVLTFIKMPISDCGLKKNYSGILGMDVFFDKKLSIQIDFSNNKLCNISDVQIQDLLNDKNYHLIKSVCKRSQIIIFVTIEGKEYPFKLDTGYSGNIIIPYSPELKFKNTNSIELNGFLYQTASSNTYGKEILYEKMPVSFGDFEFETKISTSTSIKAQNIGIEFIKGFDWIIDYNNNKVYIKRNQNKIYNQFSRKISYYSKSIKNNLLITTKEKSQTKFNLNDRIVSVNNQKVTPENICEMQDLLNKTEDWDTLKLEVVKGI